MGIVPQEERPFKGVIEAVTFALAYGDRASPPRSAVSKAADEPRRGNSMLAGLDGAAQAGMILSRIAQLGKTGESCVVARSAHKELPCSCGRQCCSGNKANIKWLDAISALSIDLAIHMQSQKGEGVRGMKDAPGLRRLLVARFFGSCTNLTEIASQAEVSEATAISHWRVTMQFLKKAESDAWKTLEDDLRHGQMIP